MRKALFFAVTLPIAAGIVTGVALGGEKYFNKGIYQDEYGKKISFSIGQEFGAAVQKGQGDSSIGILAKNEDSVKGTHKLLRGSEALTVYLTSSVIDLDQFVGRGVQITGQTYQRKNIGWFMDVLKLKIIK